MESFGLLAQLGLRVGIAILLGLAGVGFVRRWRDCQAGIFARSSLRVIETPSLGQRRALYLLEVRGRTMLIASAPNQLSLLAELEAVPEEAAGAECAESTPVFSHLLSGFTGSAAESDQLERLRQAVGELRARGEAR